MSYTAVCLCGKSTVEFTGTFDSQIACHCKDCRQASGGPYSTNVLVPRSDVAIKGPTKQFDITGNSGKTVSRWFCSNCGSQLSHYSPLFGDKQAIQTGNVEAFAKIPFGAEIFVKDKWAALPEIAGAGQVQAMPDL